MFDFTIVDCEWNEWGSWDTCSTTCGPGSQKRFRTKEFTEKGPFAGGTECSGDDMQSKLCTIANCSSKLS